jgi:hypothetical protein
MPFASPELQEALPDLKGDLGLRLLRRIEDPGERIRSYFSSLVARATPLTPQEEGDLGIMLTQAGSALLDFLPGKIPVRATLGLVFGTLLGRDGVDLADWETALGPRIHSATDLLRILAVHFGGDPHLVQPPRIGKFPRRLRRLILEALEALPEAFLVEDLGRYGNFWKRLGERLHPFEKARCYPRVAAAFAVLRGTSLDFTDSLGQVLMTQVGPATGLCLDGSRLRHESWGTKLERTLDEGHFADALQLLSKRPGELLRRLDHMARLVMDSQDLLLELREILEASVSRVSPALLLTVMAHLPARIELLKRRVFLPKGRETSAWGAADTRRRLSSEVVEWLLEPVEEELLRRAGELPVFSSAVLDLALRDLLIPFQARSASRSLVAIPRGSSLPLPAGNILRLFLHWMESPETRVDLDLSVSFYDAAWQMQGLCDYTHLCFLKDAAVHSGDLTSAPAPMGASEFLDLDLEKLRAGGVRHLIMLIFSYNNVPFEEMPRSFAGFQIRTGGEEQLFDPLAVRQRLDLTGPAKISVPMLIDLETKSLRWVDVNMPPQGRFHSVGGYRAALAHLGRDLHGYYGSGARPTMWDLACLHAAARCQEVEMRSRQGASWRLRRGEEEAPREFFARLRSGHLGGTAGTNGGDASHSEILHGIDPCFYALETMDLVGAPGSEVYSLFPGPLPEEVCYLQAADLVGKLGAPGYSGS